MNKKAIILVILIIATIISLFAKAVFDNHDDFPQIEEGKRLILA